MFVAALVRDAARSGSRFRGLVECGASAANLPEPRGAFYRQRLSHRLPIGISPRLPSLRLMGQRSSREAAGDDFNEFHGPRCFGRLSGATAATAETPIGVSSPVRDLFGQVGGRRAGGGRPVHVHGCRFSAQGKRGRQTGYPIVEPEISRSVFELGPRRGFLPPPPAGPHHALDQRSLHSLPGRKRAQHIQCAPQTILGKLWRGR